MAYKWSTPTIGSTSAYGGGGSINDYLSNPEFQKALLEASGQGLGNSVKKVGLLERILSPLMAVGSVPDAILEGMKGGNMFKEYGENLVGGMKQFATGNDSLELDDTQDILRRLDMFQGNDLLSKAARFGVGFAGDVALDPTTYLSFGTGGLAKGAATKVLKETAEALAKQGLKEIGEKTAIELGEVLAKKGAKAGAELLIKEGSDDAARILSQLALKAPQKRTVSAFGKQLAEGKLATGIEAFVNPISPLSSGVVKGLDKYAPKVTDTARGLFNEGAWASSKGLGSLRNFARGVEDELGGAERLIDTKIINDVNVLKSIGDDVAPHLLDFMEGSTSAIPTSVMQKLKAAQSDPTIAKSFNSLRTAIDASGGAVKDRGLIEGLLENYVPHTIKGFKKDNLANFFGKETAGILLEEPKVLKSIEKNGFVHRDVIKDLMKRGSPITTKFGDAEAMVKSGDFDGFVESISKGGGSELPSTMFGKANALLEGHDLQRTFKNMAEGEGAGLIYDKDISTAIRSGLTRNEKAVRLYDATEKLKTMTDDFGNKLAVTKDKLTGPLSDWATVPIKGFEDMYVPKDAVSLIKNNMKSFIDEDPTAELLKAYDWAQNNLFKKMVTVLSPNLIGFNVRNMIGDVTNMVSGGFGFRNGMFRPDEATKSFKKAIDIQGFEKMARKGGWESAVAKYGDEVADTYEKALSSGILGNLQIFDESGIAKMGSQTKQRAMKAKQMVDKVEDKIISPQRKLEEGRRLANFIDHLEQAGGDVKIASAKAKLSSLDYSNLTKFEKDYMKRVMPFYSFFRQNLELHAKNLGSKPGALMMEQDFFRNLGGALSDSGATQEDWDALPEWMKSGLSVITGKSGSEVNVLTGFGDPVSAIGEAFGTEGSDPISILKSLLGSTSPLIKMPLELSTDRNLFTGEAISDSTSAERYDMYPDAVKKALGIKEMTGTTSEGKDYNYSTMDPITKYLAENLPVVSPWNTMGKRVSDVQKDPAMITNLISGGRLYRKDLDYEKGAREREQSEKLAKELERAGLTRTYTGTYLNKSVVNNYPEMEEMLKDLGYKPEATKKKPTKKKENKSIELSKVLETYGY